MVEVHVKVRVCDKCKDVNRPVRSYTLTEGERVVKRDLCDEHAQPVEDLMVDDVSIPVQAPAVAAATKTAAKKAPAKKAPAKKATAGRKRGATKTLTVEEIKALRQPQA
ncbi:hypothetical protein AB0D63_20790 [Kitasatospora sp. NPDC048343]|uniref:hypothetical protein n=1 Tax=Kitasatospora sp. NPDC048343 TaxID=3154717 RepID=UPI0033C1B465